MPIPMGETIRAKAEELKTKVRTRIEEIRGGGSSGGILGGNPGVLKGPLATEFREKGVLATARTRLEKFRGGGGLLGGGAETAPPTPAAPPTPKATMYPATAVAPERVDMMTRARLY